MVRMCKRGAVSMEATSQSCMVCCVSNGPKGKRSVDILWHKSVEAGD